MATRLAQAELYCSNDLSTIITIITKQVLVTCSPGITRNIQEFPGVPNLFGNLFPRNEAKEELGIQIAPDIAEISPLFTHDFMGPRNRVAVSCFRVVMHKPETVTHDDGEVVWGQWMSVADLTKVRSDLRHTHAYPTCQSYACVVKFSHVTPFMIVYTFIVLLVDPS
jgi:hypothetical protein